MSVNERIPNGVAGLNFGRPAETKDRIEKAAIVSGMTINDFAINALAASADAVLENHHTRVLSNRDRDIFLDMLENPLEPNEALLEAVAEYKRRVISR